MLEKLNSDICLLNNTLKRNGYNCFVYWIKMNEDEFLLLVKKDGHEISFYEGPLEDAIDTVLDIHNFILSICILGGE